MENVKNKKTVYEATSSSLKYLSETFPEYAELLTAFIGGESKVELRKRYMLKQIDEAWVRAIEDAIPSIDAVIRNPESILREDEEVLPVELTRKVTERSVVYLSQHTDMINEIRPDGTVMPSKILNVFQDDTALTYENKFINTLLLRMYSFVLKRYDIAVEVGEDVKNTTLTVEQEFEEKEKTGKIKLSIEVSEPPKENEEVKNYIYNSGLWKRVLQIKNITDKYMSSSFVAMLGKNYVRPPIMRTNKLLKNVDFNKCLTLWEFLDSYENAGYETLISESLENVPEQAIRDLYNTVAADYVIFDNHILNEFIDENTLDKRSDPQISPIIKNELDEFDASEYDYEKPTPKYGADFDYETEDEIEYAINVAIAADRELLVQDDLNDTAEESKFGSIYLYSFASRLITTGNPNQLYYSEIKNELLSYAGVKSKESFRHETFNLKRNFIAMTSVKGKTLCLYLPLKSDEVKAKYRLKDVTLGGKELGLLKVRSDRSLKYARELIAVVMEDMNAEKTENYVYYNFRKPYKTTKQMLKLGLIKYKNKQLASSMAAEDENAIMYSYRYSFAAKLVMTGNPNQDYYTELKNELLSYTDVKGRESFRHEVFNYKREPVAVVTVRGKTLCVYVPCAAEENKAKYRLKSVVVNKKQMYLLKVKSDRGVKRAKRLIAAVASELGLGKNETFKRKDYHTPSMSIKQMLDKGMIQSANKKTVL